MNSATSNEGNKLEVDLNVMEEAIANSAQSVLGEKKGVKVEVVLSLPQMITPECYMSAEMQPSYVSFGRIIPAASFFVVGVDSKLNEALGLDVSWMIETVESAWREFFPKISCQLGEWSDDLSKIKSLPPFLNLRFVRFSVFCYRDGRPEKTGYFDILGKYIEG